MGKKTNLDVGGGALEYIVEGNSVDVGVLRKTVGKVFDNNARIRTPALVMFGLDTKMARALCKVVAALPMLSTS